MSINQTFGSGSMWGRLRSRTAYRFYFWSFAILLVSGLVLRLEAVIYGRQITSAVTALSTLRVGETTKTDALSRMPDLRLSAGPCGVPDHNADECFLQTIGNGLPGRILSRTSNSALSSLLRWWGFRFEGLDVWVTFTSGKVSAFGYRLVVSAPGVRKSMPPPPADGDLGAVVIGVLSQGIINRSQPNSGIEEHPAYVLTPARGAPSQSIGIALTPDAPEEIVHGAFDLRLHCLWSFGGCRRWNELLPRVQAPIRQSTPPRL